MNTKTEDILPREKVFTSGNKKTPRWRLLPTGHIYVAFLRLRHMATVPTHRS